MTAAALISREMDASPRQFANRPAFQRWAARVVARYAGKAVRAVYTPGGDCRTCGEAGRCPGWHTPEEFEAARRREESQQFDLSLA